MKFTAWRTWALRRSPTLWLISLSSSLSSPSWLPWWSYLCWLSTSTAARLPSLRPEAASVSGTSSLTTSCWTPVTPGGLRSQGARPPTPPPAPLHPRPCPLRPPTPLWTISAPQVTPTLLHHTPSWCQHAQHRLSGIIGLRLNIWFCCADGRKTLHLVFLINFWLPTIEHILLNFCEILSNIGKFKCHIINSSETLW